VNGFLGSYEYQMDGKGRVSLPADFRLEADSDRFVLLQWEKPYLTLFPEDEWIRFRDELLDLRKSGRRVANQSPRSGTLQSAGCCVQYGYSSYF
jgi:DNA-binding transcriptional regulator/RsmH inhibitor MraZ